MPPYSYLLSPESAGTLVHTGKPVRASRYALGKVLASQFRFYHTPIVIHPRIAITPKVAASDRLHYFAISVMHDASPQIIVGFHVAEFLRRAIVLLPLKRAILIKCHLFSSRERTSSTNASLRFGFGARVV